MSSGDVRKDQRTRGLEKYHTPETTRIYPAVPGSSLGPKNEANYPPAIARPGFGTLGTPVPLLVNWYRFEAPDLKGFHEYEVTMTEEKIVRGQGARGRGRGRGGGRPPPPPVDIKVPALCRQIFWNCVRAYPSDFGDGEYGLVYDDFKLLWTKFKLKETSLVRKEKHPEKENAEITVKITYLKSHRVILEGMKGATVDESNASKMFMKNLMSQGSRWFPPTNATANQRVMAQQFAHFGGGMHFIPTRPGLPTESFLRYMEQMGGGIFTNTVSKVTIAPGVKAWLGLYTSLRLMAAPNAPNGFCPVMNFGLVNKMFVSMKIDLVTFYAEVLNERSDTVDLSKMSLEEKAKLAMPIDRIKDFNIRFGGIQLKSTMIPCVSTQRGKEGELIEIDERHYKLIQLTTIPADTYELTTRRRGIPILEWYLNKGIRIMYPKLPLCEVKSGKDLHMIPMERLTTRDTPQRYMKMLDFYARMQATKRLSKQPQRHYELVEKLRSKLNQNEDPFLKSFGVTMDSKMVECEGRELEAATVLAKSLSSDDKENLPVEKTTGDFKIPRVAELPECDVRFAVILSFEFDKDLMRDFYRKLVEVIKEKGIRVAKEDENQPFQYREWDCNKGGIRDYLDDIDHRVKENCVKGTKVVVIVFTEPFDGLYGQIKYEADVGLGMVSQVVNIDSVKKATAKDNENRNVYYNLSMKIVAKLGGVNHIVEQSIRELNEEQPMGRAHSRTLFIGIDAIHPSPNAPITDISISCIVGSIDTHAARYTTQILVQPRCNETVHCFEGRFSRILMDRFKYMKEWPEHIVILRDGVSDSEMVRTAYIELTAIKKDWETVIAGIKGIPVPKYTYIVVQKRHRTRFYPRDIATKDHNVNMGTVMDKLVGTPHMFDFYLVSHFTPLGTTRPIHYTVVYDEVNLSADEVQEMCYRLCYLYARCSMPVSLPAPVYYAHLACTRAADYNKYTNEHPQRFPSMKSAVAQGHNESDDEYFERLSKIGTRMETVLQVHDDYPGMYFV